MSYFSTDGIAEYGIAPAIISVQPPPQRPAAQIRHPRGSGIIWGGKKTARQSLSGACCSSCGHDGLGASFSMVTPSTTPNTRVPTQTAPPPGGFVPPPPTFPPPPGFAPPAPGMSNVVKLALLAGVGVGAFLVIKRLRKKTA